MLLLKLAQMIKIMTKKSETNELANTLDFKQETIDILTADLEQLDVDKIRVLYDTLSDKLEK